METYILEREGIVADLAIRQSGWKAARRKRRCRFADRAVTQFNPSLRLRQNLRDGSRMRLFQSGGTRFRDAYPLPIYVHRLIKRDHEKRIEQRDHQGARQMAWDRNQMAGAAALELEDRHCMSISALVFRIDWSQTIFQTEMSVTLPIGKRHAGHGPFPYARRGCGPD